MNRIDAVWFTLLILMIASCKTDQSKGYDQDTLALSGRSNPTEVATVLAKRKSFEYLINTNGKVESSREVEVQFLVSGTIDEILVSNGEFIKKGKILAKIEGVKYRFEVEKAETYLKEKMIAFEDQIMSYKNLPDEKFKVIHENIRYSSGLASAEVSYKQAKLDLENTIIKSPISGVISDLIIKEGNSVKPDELFCLVHDQFSLQVSCDVLEAEAINLSLGQVARIQPVFEKEKSYRATVTSINPRVNSKTGLVRVQLTLEESKDLVPGMNVGIEIEIPSEKKNIIIPKEALVVRSGKYVVFTVENGLSKWNYVTTGRENGKEIEIINGIVENQRIVITNNLQLGHDAPVKEIQSLTQTSN